LLDDLDPVECHITWDVYLPAGVTREQIDDVFIFVMDEMEMSLEPVGADTPDKREAEPAPLASEVLVQVPASEPIPTQPIAVPPAAAQPDASPVPVQDAGAGPAQNVRTAESVRVPAGRLDELMNRVGELVIAQSRLAQLANQRGPISEILLRAISEDIERLSSELRDTTMVLRMMQVGSLFGRFRRLVHDLARETGKSIEFLTEGESTEVDKTVIERLADPLVHLIRNSCDHGLEPATVRAEGGKPATGRITVSARQAGGEVIISIADDGRGINRKAVRAKAEAQGLIAPDAVLSDQELLQLIFHPGFSTAAQITSLSGRGVGMDVVKKTVEGLRGSIAITSVEGSGTEISLHLPLTLAIVECMFVRIGAARYAIPLSAVEECLELPANEPAFGATGSGRNFLDVRGELVPYLRMRDLFVTDHPAELHPKIVVVSALGARVGLVVDQIIGNLQTVIKPLSRFHAGANVFAGATILGDGTVALIVDVGHLLASSQRQGRYAIPVGEAA
jgi:two-component system chemotaxis sensor kinase CheA